MSSIALPTAFRDPYTACPPWWYNGIPSQGGCMDPGFYAVAAVDAAVGDGVTGSRFCTLEGVVKTASPGFAYTVVNEYVASRIAGLLGLPVPPGTIAQLDDGTLSFAMMKFGKKGDKPPPADAHDLVENRPLMAAGIVLFDAWVLNQDRHAGNLAWYPGSQGSVSIFDHGHALFGAEAEKRVERLDSLVNDPCLGFGCLIGELAVASHVVAWIAQIEAVRESAIKEICQPLAGLGVCNREESVKLERVLVSRQKTLRTLIQANRDKFTNVENDDWGLYL
jgi:hypothetical protein